MDLYRNIDIQAITDKLDQIIDESIEIKNNLLEPTIKDYNEAMRVVREFIENKKRIVYGGTAYNELINNMKTEDKIYKPQDRKDIEFYTPEPIEDLIELCNILLDRGFTYVQGRQAFHDETYSVFVNFEGICDMSYMPRNVYNNMPIVKINNIHYTDPSWILVDVLRQYNDPITSYWRLKDKTFFRANMLLKHYPLKLDNQYDIPKHLEMMDIKKTIFNNIITIPSLIFIGSVAENYYLTLSQDINCSALEVISVNYREDSKTIYKYIENALPIETKKKLKINIYKPFFQFWDDRIEFMVDDICLLKIFDHNNICIPYNNLYISKNKINKIQTGGFYKEIKENKIGHDERVIKVGTFILLFNHLLINSHYEYINRRETYKLYQHKLLLLLKKRKDYLESNHLTVMDNSPYREFVIRCDGKTEDSARAFRLKIIDKKNKNKKPLFNYDPATQRNSYKVPEYYFKNTSGNLDKNEKSLAEFFD